MAIKRVHKPGELDKRLKILNQQLYGKEKSVASSKYQVARENQEQRVSTETLTTNYKLPSANHEDITYLKHDLLKISILGALAFGAQFALYFGSIHKLIKLPF